MFQETENIGGRASCQDQYDTFYANRYSQHNALELDTLESYRKDLADAKAIGRNLITEKYAFMMEFTDPEYYKQNLEAHQVLSEEGVIKELAGRYWDTGNTRLNILIWQALEDR